MVVAIQKVMSRALHRQLTSEEVGKQGVCCRSLGACRAGRWLLRPEARHILSGYACKGARICGSSFWGRRGQPKQAPIVEAQWEVVCRPCWGSRSSGCAVRGGQSTTAEGLVGRAHILLSILLHAHHAQVWRRPGLLGCCIAQLSA